MLLCYIDESGDEQPLRTPTDPPVLVLAGVVVDHVKVRELAYEFLQLKKSYYPAMSKPEVQLSDLIRFEIKGADIRRNLREGGRNKRRRVHWFLDEFLKLLELSLIHI